MTNEPERSLSSANDVSSSRFSRRPSAAISATPSPPIDADDVSSERPASGSTAHDDPWIFSFENICHALDLDPDHIREGLARWRRDQAPRRPIVNTASHAATTTAFRLRRAAG